MAKLLTLDECSLTLRNQLLGCLRSLDDAVILPGAERSDDNGHFKNIVYRLAGSEKDAPVDIFSSNWFSGVSMLKVNDLDVLHLFRNPEKMKAAMRKLADAIPSEMTDPDIQVGPHLDADDGDCDKSEWIAGFDGANCCVGLYCAEHSCAPDPGRVGMDRVHRETYLVCKAGAGIAGQTFHTRLLAALKKGQSLDECLESPAGDPGPQALRRVSISGSRNRARILMQAAKALGLERVDTISDHASKSRYRGAVTSVDVSINTIRKVEGTARSTYQYTTCVDASISSGLATCSNAADGFVLFLNSNGDVRHQLRNDAYCTIPFASQRNKKARDLVNEVAQEWKLSLSDPSTSEPAHPDDFFVRAHFCWKNRTFKDQANDMDVEPFPLWGSHKPETWLSKFSRELGLSSCQFVRLRPEAVCLAAMEPAKLRAARRHIGSSSK